MDSDYSTWHTVSVVRKWLPLLVSVRLRTSNSMHSIWQILMLWTGFPRQASARRRRGSSWSVAVSSVLGAMDVHEQWTVGILEWRKLADACTPILWEDTVESTSSLSYFCMFSLKLITVCRNWQPAIMSSINISSFQSSLYHWVS